MQFIIQKLKKFKFLYLLKRYIRIGINIIFFQKNILEQLKKNTFFNDRFINILDKY